MGTGLVHGPLTPTFTFTVESDNEEYYLSIL